MPHALVVGGTGMLKGVSLYFASHGMTVSVIARNQKHFDDLILSKGEDGFINPVRVDYTSYDLLKNKIEMAIDSYGVIESCVCWIHSTAPDAPYVIAGILNSQNIKSKYFHILGCEYANPYETNLDIEKSFEQFINISYRKVILGFVLEEEHARWLNNIEISNGVIDAIEKDRDSYIAGRVDPWEKIPKF